MDTFRQRVANLDALPQFALLGVIAGLITGAVILLLRQAIEIPLRYWLPGNDPENFEQLTPLTQFLAPLLGTLLLGLIFTYIHRDSRSIGIPHVLERLNSHNGHLSIKNAIAQFFAATISLVSGMSAGREGAAVHLGAASGSVFGRRLGLPNNSIRILVGCGTAAAISASFNTPVAGIIFAMEVVMMEYTIAGFTPVILSAVSATIVTRAVYGAEPAFNVPPLSIISLWDIPFTILMGLAFGALSAGFIKTVRYLGRLHRFPLMSRALFAGIIIGALAVVAPAIMGVGYDTVDNALTGNMALQTLCIIALIKLVATAIPVGVGIPIGLIGPIMVVGACAGAAFGIIGNILLPEHASEVGLYSMLGMGAMMGATLQAPLAALMALLELTANPNIILPGMLTIIIANITTRSIFKEPSVFAVMLQHRDIKLNHAPVQQALRRAGVVQLMNENFILHQQELAHNDVDLLSKNNPDWLVISSDGKPFQLLAGTELTRYLDTTNITQDNSDNRSPSSKIPIIDLLEIPVQRLDIKAINHQATLLEAFETLQHSGFEALYVEYQVTGKISSVAGIITRKDIENFYLYSEPPTH